VVFSPEQSACLGTVGSFKIGNGETNQFVTWKVGFNVDSIGSCFLGRVCLEIPASLDHS